MQIDSVIVQHLPCIHVRRLSLGDGNRPEVIWRPPSAVRTHSRSHSRVRCLSQGVSVACIDCVVKHPLTTPEATICQGHPRWLKYLRSQRIRLDTARWRCCSELSRLTQVFIVSPSSTQGTRSFQQGQLLRQGLSYQRRLYAPGVASETPPRSPAIECFRLEHMATFATC